MRQFMRTVKTVSLLCISLWVMAGPMEANDKSPERLSDPKAEPGTPAATPFPVVVPQPSPGVKLAPMNAKQEAWARKILQDEMSRTCSAADDAVNRTFFDALLRDFLGRRGRDMFDSGGSLRVGPPPPAPLSLPET